MNDVVNYTQPSADALPDVYLSHLFRDAGAAELRCLQPGRKVLSGVFSDPQRLHQAAQWASSSGFNVFVTLNRPASFITASNGLSSRHRCLTNGDIAKITRVPLDFDAHRPPGCNSSDAELAMAHERAMAVADFLQYHGWPEPLVATSGNGAHLQFRCDLPASAETAAAFKALYQWLHRKFSDDCVGFDTTVRNPSRIFRLYGHVNRKSSPSPGRPQRLATCTVPACWGIVAQAQFWALVATAKAELAASKPPPRREHPHPSLPSRSGYVHLDKVDLVALFQRAGLHVAQLGNGLHAVVCPWADQHTAPSPPDHSDCCIWEPGVNRTGKAQFDCKHAHCQGKTAIDAVRTLAGWRASI